MGFLHITPRKSKPANKKPGWQKAEQEYAEWQSKMATMSSGITGVRTLKTLTAPVKKPQAHKADILPAKYVIGSGTKPVHRPEIQYRDDPEMLERELIARQRKFNAAPMYNKGGDGYVSEEMLQELLSSNKRRS